MFVDFYFILFFYKRPENLVIESRLFVNVRVRLFYGSFKNGIYVQSLKVILNLA